MKDLKKNSMSDMYDKMDKMDEYPCICLPLDIFENQDVEPGDMVTIVLKGKVKNINMSETDKSFMLEAQQGEASMNSKEVESKEQEND